MLSWKDFADKADEKPAGSRSQPIFTNTTTHLVSSDPSQPVTESDPIIKSESVISKGPTPNEPEITDRLNNVPSPSISAWGSINRQEEVTENGAEDESADNWKKSSWKADASPVAPQINTPTLEETQAAPQWASLVLNATKESPAAPSKELKQQDHTPSSPQPDISSQNQDDPSPEQSDTTTMETTLWKHVKTPKLSTDKNVPTETISWNDFSSETKPTDTIDPPNMAAKRLDEPKLSEDKSNDSTQWNTFSAKETSDSQQSNKTLAPKDWSGSKETKDVNPPTTLNETSNWGQTPLQTTSDWTQTTVESGPQGTTGWNNLSVEDAPKKSTRSVETVPKETSNWNNVSVESTPKEPSNWNTVSVENTSKEPSNWNTVSVESTPKESSNWNTVSVENTPKEASNWNTVSEESIVKETSNWNTSIESTPKEAVNWNNTSIESTPKEASGWNNASIESTPKEASNWNNTAIKNTPDESSNWNTTSANEHQETTGWNSTVESTSKETTGWSNTPVSTSGWNDTSTQSTNWNDTPADTSVDSNQKHSTEPHKKNLERGRGSPAVVENTAIPVEERASSGWAQMSAEALPEKVYSRPTYRPTYNRHRGYEDRGQRKYENHAHRSPIQHERRGWNSNNSTPGTTHATVAKNERWGEKSSWSEKKPFIEKSNKVETSVEATSWNTTETGVKDSSWGTVEQPMETSSWSTPEKSVEASSWSTIEKPVETSSWSTIEKPVESSSWNSAEKSPAEEQSSWNTTEKPSEEKSWAVSESTSTSRGIIDDSNAKKSWGNNKKSSWDKSSEKRSWTSTSEKSSKHDSWTHKSTSSVKEPVSEEGWATKNKVIEKSPQMSSWTPKVVDKPVEPPSVKVTPAPTSTQSSWSASPAIAESSSTTWSTEASTEEPSTKPQGGWGGEIRSNGWSTSPSNSSTNWNADKKAANQARQNNYNKPRNNRGYLSQRVENQSAQPVEEYHRGDEDSDVEIILEADEESDWVKNEQILGMTAPEEEVPSPKLSNHRDNYESQNVQPESTHYKKNFNNTNRKPRRNFDDNWRQRDEVNHDLDEHHKYQLQQHQLQQQQLQQQSFHHSQHHGVPMYYPQPHPQMNGGNMPYLPLIPNGPNGSPMYPMPYPMGIPSSPATGSISPNNSVGGDSSPHIHHHTANFYPPMINGPNGFQLPPGYEANGMVYYGMDPAAMYGPPPPIPPQPFYYYAPMPMNAPMYSPQHHPILPQHKMIEEEDLEEDDGWGPSPEIVEEQWETKNYNTTSPYYHQPNNY